MAFATKASTARPSGAFAASSPKLSLNGNGKRSFATPQNGGEKSATGSSDPLTARLLTEEGEGDGGSTRSGAAASGPSSCAAASSNQGQGSQGKGTGRGRGRNRNVFKEKVKLGGATLAEQVKNLTAALVMTMRLVRAHAQEFRRLAKEGNACLLLERKSHTPGRLNEAQTQWREEIREEDEANPFPTNNDGPWRFRAFGTVVRLVTTAESNIPPTGGDGS